MNKLKIIRKEILSLQQLKNQKLLEIGDIESEIDDKYWQLRDIKKTLGDL